MWEQMLNARLLVDEDPADVELQGPEHEDYQVHKTSPPMSWHPCCLTRRCPLWTQTPGLELHTLRLAPRPRFPPPYVAAR
mmetsp:Transcript_38115/g.62660  ORF Transcript_38115/g.62660 Transcript_38115/m.62660 type:complete len:80 (+) Transcript_38115:736-975(+)